MLVIKEAYFILLAPIRLVLHGYYGGSLKWEKSRSYKKEERKEIIRA